jgi:hypothetical protein
MARTRITRRTRALVAGLMLLSAVQPAFASRAPAGKPKADITFNLAGRTFTEKERVRMYGDVDPAQSSETVTLHTQRYNKKDEEWKHYDMRKVDSDSDGKFSYKHPSFRKGNYRTRAEVDETDDHLAGKTRWKTMAVRRRNF